MPYLSHITNEEVAALEVETFPGKIVVVSNLRELSPAVQHLRSQPILGFDTETRPNFRKGECHEVALLQLSTDDTCYLFRLNILGMPPDIEEILADAGILKVGLSLGDDFRALRQRTQVTFANFTDLQDMVKRFGDIREAGLRKMYAIIFRKSISKGQRLSNWEAERLSLPQQRYAALDAWACLRIYRALASKRQQDFAEGAAGTDEVYPAGEGVGDEAIPCMGAKDDTSVG
jgi:ribonuclease D